MPLRLSYRASSNIGQLLGNYGRLVSALLRFFVLRIGTLNQGVRTAEHFFQALVAESTNRLARTVPVRTGLLRRHVDARRLGGFSVAIYSDAKNQNNREYAQWVRRYDRALASLTRSVTGQVARQTFRFIDYGIVGGDGNYVITRRPVLIGAVRFIGVDRTGTRMILSFRVPLNVFRNMGLL